MPGYTERPCEDAPCCGHGGVCGQAIGMSRESYLDGFDSRSDEAIKQAVYDRWTDPDDDPMDPMYDEGGW